MQDNYFIKKSDNEVISIGGNYAVFKENE